MKLAFLRGRTIDTVSRSERRLRGKGREGERGEDCGGEGTVGGMGRGLWGKLGIRE